MLEHKSVIVVVLTTLTISDTAPITIKTTKNEAILAIVICPVPLLVSLTCHNPCTPNNNFTKIIIAHTPIVKTNTPVCILAGILDTSNCPARYAPIRLITSKTAKII